jgi:hypothetical protein
VYLRRASRGPFVGALALGEAAQPPKEVSAMAELHIKSLKCVKKHDPTGKDEAKLQINGSTIAGPLSLGKGDSVTLNAREDFTGSVQVTLIEEDAGKDDNLGTVTIKDTLAGDGDQTAVFNAKTHADYHMTYDVHTS